MSCLFSHSGGFQTGSRQKITCTSEPSLKESNWEPPRKYVPLNCLLLALRRTRKWRPAGPLVQRRVRRRLFIFKEGSGVAAPKGVSRVILLFATLVSGSGVAITRLTLFV